MLRTRVMSDRQQWFHHGWFRGSIVPIAPDLSDLQEQITGVLTTGWTVNPLQPRDSN